MIEVLGLLLALGLLIAGSEGLIRSGSSLALRLGVAPIWIGMILIGCGTSMPEFLVSLKAARAGQGALALGNVIGSNSFNIAFILGLTALLLPLKSDRGMLKANLPVLGGSAFLLVFLLRDGHLGVFDGLLLLGAFAVVALASIRLALRERHPDRGEAETKGKPWLFLRDLLLGILSLGVMLWGAGLFLRLAVVVGTRAGLGEHQIGAVILAAGTSLPELTISVFAALRGQASLALGNVIGSNIFNTLFILGGVSTLGELNGSDGLLAEQYLMLAVTLLLALFMWTGLTIRRWEGAALLSSYIAFQFLRLG